MNFLRQRRWLITAIAVLFLMLLGFCFSLFPFLKLPATVPVASNPVSSLAQNPQQQTKNDSYNHPDVAFTLRTAIGEGKLIFTGQGSKIDGQVNPNLTVSVGDVVQITLIDGDGDGAEHDIIIPDFKVQSGRVKRQGAASIVTFQADKEGTFTYLCSIPGHKEAGMIGQLIVKNQNAAQVFTETKAANIIQSPTAIPQPIGKRNPQLVRVSLETTEVEGQLADGTTYSYWTYNGKVPGPFVRVRIGDTVELRMKNNPKSRNLHSIDLHAVTGQGGGAALTQTSPGDEKVFTFKPLNPGLFVYHCATPIVAQHISHGMYGLILVEPEGGLSKVDREFYVMQGELYTVQPTGYHGNQEFSVDKLLKEQPEYFVFNGASKALVEKSSLHAKVGEKVRIFFGVGGPNYTSAFHVIGEVFDRVYPEASLTSTPLTNLQTTSVPPGGATMVEFKVEVPGRFMLVDHALSRLEKGLVGHLIVDGEPQPNIYRPGTANTGT
ncbi:MULTISPECIES: copper-containing nitrite reductase [unclassified Nostoc]|uniref:copper-containing nitrite reductase n=1 Tax=unclassified Nostoc TaxID=2593658 RepID=UPI0025AA6E8B|nr:MULTISPECIES: copper-containing nitrite reductase [unclassified Nostoc]MDM9584816.1 copper-containing nitrite reductase [Nostoc sp. GT001]MDZ7944375.1 copper-containing nitrite reductase [Nostoc sp. EfeVER01]MDZ7991821.1 copper-containing nitrite reductase [Nostoc sp. EspVER01]